MVLQNFFLKSRTALKVVVRQVLWRTLPIEARKGCSLLTASVGTDGAVRVAPSESVCLVEARLCAAVLRRGIFVASVKTHVLRNQLLGF